MLLQLLKRSLFFIALGATTALHLNITAIGARDGRSTLECWQLEEEFIISNTAGVAGSASSVLSDAANSSIVVIPSGFDGGLHNAPHNQWVLFTTGLALITLPENNSAKAYVTGGEFGLIFAADTADVSRLGHRTQYPGITETIAIQIPTKDNRVPAHTCLYDGACSAGEVVGLRGLAVAG
ncbi:hypothetical protein TruAng_005048 [Truncatella angustata]|nr:hypothetical protein TruAng_005048 [Truncatella angustata]